MAGFRLVHLLEEQVPESGSTNHWGLGFCCEGYCPDLMRPIVVIGLLAIVSIGSSCGPQSFLSITSDTFRGIICRSGRSLSGGEYGFEVLEGAWGGKPPCRPETKLLENLELIYPAWDCNVNADIRIPIQRLLFRTLKLQSVPSDHMTAPKLKPKDLGKEFLVIKA